MKICIIGPKEIKDQEKWLIEEAKSRFNKVAYAELPEIRISNGDAYFRNTPLSSYDCIFPRIPRTYMNHGYNICKILEDVVFIPVTPESIILSHNKFLTLLKLDEARLPTPLTYYGSNTDVFREVLNRTHYPVVVKLVYGSLGKGVMFAESRSSAIPLLDTLESMKQPILVEEYVRNPGEDIRALVVGGSVVAAMKRKAQRGEKRANIGVGGTGKKINISRKLRGLAEKTAKVLGLGIAGIDIIESRNGPYVIEANVNVHFEGITQATQLNIAGMMMDYAKKEAEHFAISNFTGNFYRAVDKLWKG